MFASRYFANSYFPRRYFANAGMTVTIVYEYVEALEFGTSFVQLSQTFNFTKKAN